MKVGIVGAENSHAAAIAKLINVEQRFKGVTVDIIWGETAEFAIKTAEAGSIPQIAKKPQDMLGRVDAVIVDHRHPKHHVKAAMPFVKEGIPCFVDKPFCYRAAEGKTLLKAAAKHGAPLTSFSAVPHQRSYRAFVRKLEGLGRVVAGTLHGACDLHSKYGGIFFYGIHQVDAALNAFGYNVSRVLVTKNGNGATGQLLYSDGKIVTLNLVREGCPGFSIGAVGAEGGIFKPLVFDKNTYLAGVRLIVKMFKTGEEPCSAEQMLKPVQVLEAMEKSVKSGSTERVMR